MSGHMRKQFLPRMCGVRRSDLCCAAPARRPCAQAPTDPVASDEQLAARIDALVSAHLLGVTARMAGLQAALAASAKQQHALLCFLAMLGGVMALNATRFAEQWPRAKWAVLCLAAANGLVGVALQLQGSHAGVPSWVQALPWGSGAGLGGDA